MKIKNVKILQADGGIADGNIGVSNRRFVSFEEGGKDEVDGDGALMVPGLIDIHLHGCSSFDFSDATPEALETMLAFELSVGVTSILPTSMTVDEKLILKTMQVAGEHKNNRNSTLATLQGVHVEGPFINPSKKGAQDETYIKKCDRTFFEEMQKQAQGKIRLIDVAPEMEGALDFIKEISPSCRISIAHTDASYDIAKEAYELGASHLTHMYNAMPPFLNRAPGVIGAAFDSKKVFVELICDSVHVHPSVVRASFEMFGKDRIVFISDSMRATGMKDGRSSLGGQDVEVNGRKAVLVSDGTLAGSVTHLMDCVRIANKEMYIPLAHALNCATINPARAIGIDKEYGSIEIGKIADFLLLDDDLNLKAVYKNGQQIEGGKHDKI